MRGIGAERVDAAGIGPTGLDRFDRDHFQAGGAPICDSGGQQVGWIGRDERDPFRPQSFECPGDGVAGGDDRPAPILGRPVYQQCLARRADQIGGAGAGKAEYVGPQRVVGGKRGGEVLDIGDQAFGGRRRRRGQPRREHRAAARQQDRQFGLRRRIGLRRADADPSGAAIAGHARKLAARRLAARRPAIIDDRSRYS